MPAPRILGTAAALVLTATVLTACSGAPEEATPEETGDAATPTTVAPDPSPTPEPEPASNEIPTCETLIGETVVADFESIGWSAEEKPLYIGSTQIEGGIQCMWADFSGPAGDHGQTFGWAPLDEEAASAAQTELVSQGWIREEDASAVYVTESPSTVIAPDENGYGITYRFADGQVTVADTKQGLLLIEWPRG
ncbi:hypothetical protein [Microbacterium atlanticum]|uniref:hypothetical protein n=1 Tax=Microbacterium atlanticum TaxID=2782168 RepID=UPI001886E1DB|nr:hypothetical protein [Microbacterium atlanticum]